ncbi:D-glycerate dehydrogenase [Shimia sp. CNT1-13L.2]|uniref:2-hydroxyacid dehydrogenase n=1 Tax=Shimia sp. CNT1-13L.2 TaxID=2959663 RepID=UPI0020CECD26|nr:D-glycerate dehydrogenase [Shimia sp. CNT1-13L.2]MCP9483749.1 D-glycerate dehydrogenase [Shimia sp. CNT1-13L.2]
MKRLYITRPLPERVIEVARGTWDVSVRQSNRPLNDEELRRCLRDFDAVLPTLGDMFSASVFADVPEPRCKVLANFGVGYNHIDVAAANKAGIAVSNTPGAVTDATADVALTLMLMCARRAGEGERLVRSGQWEGWHPTQMLGMHMSGKTVGIVGMGRIGQAIAQRCYFGFGMKVKYFNRSPKSMEFDAQQVEDLADLAHHVDFLVTAVPGGAETRNLIGAKVFDAMHRDAYFINIARGDVVDEPALIHALQTKAIGGAGLDVYAKEPEVPEALRLMENVVLLPHLGTAALEVRTNMGMMAVENLQAFADGRRMPNQV